MYGINVLIEEKQKVSQGTTGEVGLWVFCACNISNYVSDIDGRLRDGLSYPELH